MAFTRVLFAFLALPGVAAGVVPVLILGGRFHLGPAAVAGGAMMGAGVFLLLWCARDSYVSGRGTIAAWDPPRRLVVEGPYRLVRNPMYVAVLGLVGGWAPAFASPALTAYRAVLAAGFHGRVVPGEEPWLRRRFGPEWDVYCRQVPRWLPRLPLSRAGSGRQRGFFHKYHLHP